MISSTDHHYNRNYPDGVGGFPSLGQGWASFDVPTMTERRFCRPRLGRLVEHEGDEQLSEISIIYRCSRQSHFRIMRNHASESRSTRRLSANLKNQN